MNPDLFIKILKNECQLDFKLPVLAGISGGPDSLCMLDLLIKTGIPVFVIHINHQLRPEADAEAKKVLEYCDKHEVNCTVITGDIKDFATTQKISIEEAARNFRYTRLFEQAKKVRAQAVLVAHNADDQVETVLMHLLRGSGNRGLRGMQMRSIQKQWSTAIPLLRPLLMTSRGEILKYCNENDLTPSFDESNQDTRYFRNRIRQELVPELQTYNPEITERLLNMSQVIQVEEDFVRLQAEIAWKTCLLQKGAQFVRFDRAKLLEYHPCLVRRVIWMAIHGIDETLRDIDFNVIERSLEFIEKKSGSNHLMLLADIEMIKFHHNELLVCRQGAALTELWPKVSDDNKREIRLDGVNDLGTGWKIRCQKTSKMDVSHGDAFVCFLDGDKIDRAWLDTVREGDFFSPYGMKGKTQKLGDYWTNQGIPERARKFWPLVRTEEDEIVWVAGMQISDKYKITAQTVTLLKMTLHYLPNEN